MALITFLLNSFGFLVISGIAIFGVLTSSDHSLAGLFVMGYWIYLSNDQQGLDDQLNMIAQLTKIVFAAVVNNTDEDRRELLVGRFSEITEMYAHSAFPPSVEGAMKTGMEGRKFSSVVQLFLGISIKFGLLLLWLGFAITF